MYVLANLTVGVDELLLRSTVELLSPPMGTIIVFLLKSCSFKIMKAVKFISLGKCSFELHLI